MICRNSVGSRGYGGKTSTPLMSILIRKLFITGAGRRNTPISLLNRKRICQGRRDVTDLNLLSFFNPTNPLLSSDIPPSYSEIIT